MFERVERAVKKFEAENFMVKQATEDADALIINTAISVSSAFDFVIVVGEDADLLILLTALSTRSNIYSAFFLTVAIGNCMVKLIPPVNFCSDENIQTIFGTKLEDF
jgi:hypothetical protein